MDPTGISMLVGGGLGALQGGLEYGEQRKQRKAQEAATRPRRRKLHQAQQGMASMHQQRMAGMSMLAQASQDWASSLRY